MKINPTYVSFEQALWLKEKGFDIHCNNWFKFTEGNWELGKCQLFKPEFIKTKNLTEDKDDY